MPTNRGKLTVILLLSSLRTLIACYVRIVLKDNDAECVSGSGIAANDLGE